MKTPEQIKPNFGPIYAAAMYPELAGIFQQHGYALAVHGSLARDFDLIAIPWAESVAVHETIFTVIEANFAVTVNRDAAQRPHGRTAYIISVGWGECFIDLSFINSPMPSTANSPQG